MPCLWELRYSLLLVSMVSFAESCPTLFYYNSSTHQCECEKFPVHYCNQFEGKVAVSSGYCVTGKEGHYLGGKSPFSLRENRTNRIYSVLPTDPDLLNETMCGPYNRKGLLCGECIDGFGPAAYTLDLQCLNCSDIFHRICFLSVLSFSAFSNHHSLLVYHNLSSQYNNRSFTRIYNILPVLFICHEEQ